MNMFFTQTALFVATVFSVAPSLANRLALEGEPELFESCYTVENSDKLEDGEPVSVKIFRHQNTHGQHYYTADLYKGDAFVVRQVGTIFSSDSDWFSNDPRGELGSWRFTGKVPVFFELSLYRTQQTELTPTSVNAHVLYTENDLDQKKETFRISVSRLECEKRF